MYDITDNLGLDRLRLGPPLPLRWPGDTNDTAMAINAERVANIRAAFTGATISLLTGAALLT